MSSKHFCASSFDSVSGSVKPLPRQHPWTCLPLYHSHAHFSPPHRECNAPELAGTWSTELRHKEVVPHHDGVDGDATGHGQGRSDAIRECYPRMLSENAIRESYPRMLSENATRESYPRMLPENAIRGTPVLPSGDTRCAWGQPREDSRSWSKHGDSRLHHA